ncbi:MBL fold metallo-hydrolase [Streptomyces sp. 7N604]|uniref:MBL fold metallo-hydrolase n=1 Tax=Streptomyces sp. 7N604 TaxID=3457415 RepID=UPI003FCEFCA9
MADVICHEEEFMVASDVKLEEVADGVFAYLQLPGGWCLNNAGFVVGSEESETVLIDTAATEGRARALRDTVVATAGRMPGVLVNTHHHGDHTFGNHLFTPHARVVAHPHCREEILRTGVDLPTIWPDVAWGDIAVTLPTTTYADRMTLHNGDGDGSGDGDIELIHPGVAHTVGDTVVWLPEQRVVFTGDLIFSGGTPFVFMGSVAGSLAAVWLLRGLGAETVVPGHGPVCGPEVYDMVERYLTWILRLAEQGREAGITPRELALEADLGEFAGLGEPERLVMNLHRAYAELEGLPDGTPLPLPDALADVIACNGGAPPVCHA